MARDVNQILLSKETDSWDRQWHGCIGTVIGGTVSLSAPVPTSRDRNFVTDVSFQSNLVGASFDIMNGTAFLYQMQLPVIGMFSQKFDTPLKGSQGTQINFHIYNLLGTVSFNVDGYTIK